MSQVVRVNVKLISICVGVMTNVLTLSWALELFEVKEGK